LKGIGKYRDRFRAACTLIQRWLDIGMADFFERALAANGLVGVHGKLFH
jgi:hypothetical protein